MGISVPFHPINVCRCDLDAAVLTPRSNDPIGTHGVVSGWLCELGTSMVSGSIFLCLIDTDALDFELYSFDLHPIALLPGPNDPMQTFRVVSGWLCYAGASTVSHFAFLSWADFYRSNFDSSVLTAVLPLHPALNGKITNHSVLLSSSLLQPQCVNTSQVSLSAVLRSTDVSRLHFDAATLTDWSVDIPVTF